MIIHPVDPNLNIVRNGLKFWVDARIQTSYPGSGATWFDLSGNDYDATLNGNYAYQTDNGGRINFDGNNDYAEISSSLGSLFTTTNQNISYCMWLRPTVNQANNTIRILFNVYTTGFGGGRVLTIERTSGGQYRLTAGMFVTSTNRADSAANISNPQNTWINVVYLWDTDKYSIYLNGSELTYTTQTSLTADNNTSSTPIRIAGDFALANPEFQGQIGSFMIYDRLLSSTEITHNYNTQKVRFGL